MIAVFYILLVLLFIYAVVLIGLSAGFVATKDFSSNEEEIFLPVTIIICARNEEKKIGKCLKSIVQQDYDLSKIQLIVVNDASNESTVFQAQNALKDSQLNYKIISNPSRKGKKQSITYGMQFAEHDLIITRDADTFTKSFSWLKSISDFQRANNCDLIIGPLAINDNFGILWALQAIENNVLAVLNVGSAFFKKPFLASGANLIFTRAIFEKTKGYSSHISVESGDDVLFLEDVKKITGSKIRYLKSSEAIVYTYPTPNFSALLKQKVRWASKFKINPNKTNLSIAILSFIINAAWIFCLLYGFLIPQKGELSLIFVLLKLVIDILLLFLASRFIKNKSLALYAIPVGCVYPIYAVIVAIRSVFYKPKWN